jgi:hypothetical protein
MSRRASNEITKKNYKNLSVQSKNELIDNLFYEFSQNLKIPFVEFIKQPKQLLAMLAIFLVVWVLKKDGDSTIYLLTEASKYCVVAIAILYKFTRQKMDDILI